MTGVSGCVMFVFVLFFMVRSWKHGMEKCLKILVLGDGSVDPKFRVKYSLKLYGFKELFINVLEELVPTLLRFNFVNIKFSSVIVVIIDLLPYSIKLISLMRVFKKLLFDCARR